MGRFLPLLALAILAGSCASKPAPGPLPAAWNIGFWVWHFGDAAPGPPVDVVYHYSGGFRKDYTHPIEVFGNLPDNPPAARAYWLVFRYDGSGLPPAQLIPKLLDRVRALALETRRRGLPLAGIQLDIDSPSRSLPEYAAFLRQVKAGLPPGTELSITALLDWFRPSTAIASVIQEVDEFVPQFYDVQDPRTDRPDSAIAAPFNAAKWNPVFQRFRRRFRIGISTFGRARFVPGPELVSYINIRDAEPIHLALLPDFKASTSLTPAREVVLRYEAVRRTKVAYTEFAPGAAIEFTLATPESIQTAVEQVRSLGGFCAGVLFFRWPGTSEPLAMPPADIVRAAKGQSSTAEPAQIRAVKADCAAVSCVDLYLVNSPRLSPRPTRFQLLSTVAVDYFVPSERGPARLAGPQEIAFTLPPYCGRNRLYLGRAVTPRPATFTLQEVP